MASTQYDDFIRNRITELRISKNISEHKKIAEELEDCDPAELQAFLEIIQSTKKVLRTNRKVTITY